MKQARLLSMFTAITLWAIIVGGVVYSHIAYFPSYLSHLPESNSLITGNYGIKDESFWILIHQLAILSTILALIINWKLKTRRKFILIPLGIYALALVATFVYFLPELRNFADSANNIAVTPAEWLQRGQSWQLLSWIRGSFMYVGFLMMVIALTKDNSQNIHSYK